MNVWVFKCFYVKALLYGNYNGMDKYPLQVQYCESAVLNAPGSEMRDKRLMCHSITFPFILQPKTSHKAKALTIKLTRFIVSPIFPFNFQYAQVFSSHRAFMQIHKVICDLHKNNLIVEFVCAIVVISFNS